MRRPRQRRAISRAGVLRALALGCAGLVLGVLGYAGLVQAGLLRSPFPAARGDIELARSDRDGLRVLFVGNSFTYYNSMPELVEHLAAGDEEAPLMITAEYTAPGWTLREASEDDGLADLIEDVPWDIVVLQEQSQVLSFSEQQRRRETYPFARALRREIALTGARTVLFMTWGYENGDRSNVHDDTFLDMQARLADGYSDLGAELSAPVAPVGVAWADAVRRAPGLDLWASDGRHPNRMGSYLAACVFYAFLSGRDPGESDFAAGLDPADARFLQRVAWRVVHGD